MDKFNFFFIIMLCVRKKCHFLCGVCGCPYNDLVICKDSSDCLQKAKNIVIRDTGHNILTYRKLSRPS